MTKIPLLYLEKLSKTYGHYLALDAIDLTLEAGQIVGLLGPNGSGKTSLLKLINGLLQPDSGTLLIQGQKPSLASKKIISYLPDLDHFHPDMKINQLVGYFQDFYPDFRASKAQELLDELALDGQRPFKDLDKALKAKVKLILAMSRQADLYLLDDPICQGDPANSAYILRIIKENRPKEASVLIASHLPVDLEEILDQVIFIKAGKILLHEPKEKLYQEKQESIEQIFRFQYRL
ncbi:ATP-binding cassette domain-containing protein [Streptococcus oricebi]|uniref:ABC transporter ATP-binding protein n=1 Tax=Streptococcus oricebi TaxID=1547447 RepID=A0ABS5B2L9_9STRE|nr:ABC transporter ATP-binding protein [Streptococcus oricebi]MBP2623078.1 ABC transporter ATP-binding protein [Streptococcus oricebi]